MVGNVLQVDALGGGAGTQVSPAGGKPGVLGGQGLGAVPGEHELHEAGRHRTGGLFVEGLQHLHGPVGGGLGAFDLELFVAVCDAHFQRALDGAQMLVERAAQVGQPAVVKGGEAVA